MSIYSELADLLMKQAYLQNGGGKKSTMQEVGELLGTTGKAISAPIETYQSIRKSQLEQEKAHQEIEEQKRLLQPTEIPEGVDVPLLPKQREELGVWEQLRQKRQKEKEDEVAIFAQSPKVEGVPDITPTAFAEEPFPKRPKFTAPYKTIQEQQILQEKIKPKVWINPNDNKQVSGTKVEGWVEVPLTGYNLAPKEQKPTPKLSPEALKFWSDYVAQTGQLPAGTGFGMADLKLQLLEGGAKTSIEQGVNAADQQQKYKTEAQARRSAATNVKIEDAKINMGAHLESLIDSSYDPATDTYKIPPSMHSEMALGLARMMSQSGTIAVELEEQLRQKTAKEGMSGALIYLGFDPAEIGGTTDSVAKFFAKTISRQKAVSMKLRNSYVSSGSIGSQAETPPPPPMEDKVYKQRLNNYLSKASPEEMAWINGLIGTAAEKVRQIEAALPKGK